MRNKLFSSVLRGAACAAGALLAGLTLGLTLCACGGAGNGPLVLVTLTGDMSGVQLVRALVSVDAKDAQQPAEFKGPPQQFELELPQMTSGKLTVGVLGLQAGDPCSVSSGLDTSQTLAGQPEVDLSIPLKKGLFRVCPSPSSPVNRVWGSGASDVWFAGNGGVLWRWDGSSLTSLSAAAGTDLNAVWGTGSQNVWIVGAGGTIVRYTGGFTGVSSGTSEDLFALAGTSSGAAWAVGDNGALVGWSGQAWAPLSSGTTNVLWGVWASEKGEVWAVGKGGTILHSSDGKTFTRSSSVVTTNLYAIWGNGPTDIYAVGQQGVVLHFDGSTWQQLASGTTEALFDVWGRAQGDAYAVGDNGTLLRLKGGPWTQLPLDGYDGLTLLGTWGSSSAGDVWVVGDNSKAGLLRHFVP